jgi:hypothetical protein
MPHFRVLLHSGLHEALRALPASGRQRFSRLVHRLSIGEWGGGTRVKKLKGCGKPVAA